MCRETIMVRDTPGVSIRRNRQSLHKTSWLVKAMVELTDWNLFRSEMQVCHEWAYMDHAAVAPLPQRTREAISVWLTEATEQGDTVWPQWSKRIEHTRQLAAEMVNADVSEIGLIPNTTTGIGFVAEGFPWQSGDNIVTLANEFPSNLYPWLNLQSRGVETRMVQPVDGRVDWNQVAEACDERTRILSVSWVGFGTGWRIDPQQAANVAHDHGALLFLDAIQGMGIFPLDVKKSNIDFFAADGHKWMLGPEGAGIFYVRNEHLSTLRPLCVGWNSVKNAHNFGNVDLQIRPETSRYEGGSQNMVGMIGLAASLSLLTESGTTSETSAVGDRILQVTDMACERLSAKGVEIKSHRDGDHRSGIVAFQVPGKEPDQVRSHCAQNKIALSSRVGNVRASMHAYNNEADIDQLVDAIQRLE